MYQVKMRNKRIINNRLATRLWRC